MPELRLPSPVDRLSSPGRGVSLFVKREDQIHPLFGGNKYRKLKYNLSAFQKGKFSDLISFGGAFSNHIHALAHACALYDISAVGIIRGEYDPANPTLREVQEAGMKLHFVSRSSYREKENHPDIQRILSDYPRPYLVPEGGSNQLALKGVAELMAECDEPYDYIFLAAGTGTTAAGLIDSAPAGSRVVVINALRNPGLEDQIASLIVRGDVSWEVSHNYHFGGFARVPDTLMDWYQEFYAEYGLMLDPIYNAKAMFALMDWYNTGLIHSGAKVLYIHTGGLQGIRAFEYRSGRSWLK